MSKSAAPQFDKILKGTTDFGTGYSEACTKSSAIFMKGMEDMMDTMMSMAKTSSEKQSKLMKEAMSIKNVNDFAEMQNKIAQSGFEDMMSGATKLSEIGVSLFTDSAEPVNTQITQAVQKAKKAMAA